MGITTAQPNTLDVTYKQLSDDNTGGTILGQNTSDKISFYGVTPVVQPSGPGQAAITRGSAAGVIATIAPAVSSPSAVTPNTTAEKSITLGPTTADFQVATTDMLFVVNKPAAQAGLGVGNVRVSAANTAGVTFSNYTAATITPTASEQYVFVAIRGMDLLSPILSPAAVAPNSTVEQQFTVAGLRSGAKNMVQVSKPAAQAGLDIVGCRIVSDNTLGISFVNVTAATITPTASETYTVWQAAGLDAQNNQLVYQTLQSPSSVANATTAEQAFTMTGLLATDVVVGISKPTAQAGLLIGGMRVSAANSLGITFGNVTAATITPTASESYAVSLFRQSPVAPLVVYSVSLAPVSVAPNTTAEQTFTVTGLIASTPVWVNKPTWQAGLGIAGVRVSGTNTLAINYANSSAATITPATETYIVGNFQIPTPSASSEVLQPASVTNQNHSILDNSMRVALVAEGLIAGG